MHRTDFSFLQNAHFAVHFGPTNVCGICAGEQKTVPGLVTLPGLRSLARLCILRLKTKYMLNKKKIADIWNLSPAALYYYWLLEPVIAGEPWIRLY